MHLQSSLPKLSFQRFKEEDEQYQSSVFDQSSFQSSLFKLDLTAPLIDR
jgi:hypothetical protein